MSIKYTPTHVTPEMAADWLEHRNTHNRRFKESAIQRYMDDLRAGRWKENGDTIRFDTAGILSDGQNRLEACRRTGIGFDTCVVTGLDPDAQATMDQGVKRSGADVLRLADTGMENATLTASIAAADIRRRKGTLADAFRQGGRNAKPTAGELIAHVDAEPRLREAARRGARVGVRTAGLLSPTCAGFLWLVFDEIDSEDAAGFMNLFASGAGLEEDDPILTLRATLTRLNRNKGDQRERAAMTIKAWNKWRTGRKCSRLGWNPNGVRREPFPTPR